MSERKGSLQLDSNISAKFFGHPYEDDNHHNADKSKVHKYRGSYGNLDENTMYGFARPPNPDSSYAKK